MNTSMGARVRPGYRWVELPENVAASFDNVGVMTREQLEADVLEFIDLLAYKGYDPQDILGAIIVAAALGEAEVGEGCLVTFDRVRGYSVGEG
jgi:hypothetical protein